MTELTRRAPALCFRTSTSRLHVPFTPARLQQRGRGNTACEAQRRDVLLQPSVALMAAALLAAAQPARALVKGFTPMDALKDKDYGKPRMTYSDYTTTESGLQYVDVREGSGTSPKQGELCVVDWDGYTIGYYGRPFEARNKPKGSSFNDDNKDYLRFRLGNHEVIPAFEEAVAGMQPGGVRRIVVPEELGYPNNDYRKQGPRPSTFSGERALDFVLSNKGMIDRTLLFDIWLVRTEPST